MQCSTQNKDTRDDDCRLAAESRQCLVSFQHARDIQGYYDPYRDQVRANPLGYKQGQRDDQNREKGNLLRIDAAKHK